MKSRNAELLKIKKVNSLFNKISDGGHGNISGFHGRVTPHIVLKIFKAIDVFGRKFALCSVYTLKAKFMTLHILFLCAECVSVDSLVVFHDRKWRTPDDILKRLQEFGYFRWAYSRTIKMFMQGSGESKTAWQFYRDQLNFCCTVTSDSSPCAFLVVAYLIEVHQTRGTRCDVAVFAPLRGHCLALANAEATAHCVQPPHFGVNRLFHWPCRRWQRVGVRACQAQSASTQRHSTSDIAATLAAMPSYGWVGWEPGSQT